MMGSGMGRRGARLAMPVEAGILSLFLAAAGPFGLGAQSKHVAAKAERPERTVVSAEDIVLYPPAGAGAAFAFLPSVKSYPFDRSIALSAAPGETRSYLVKTREGPEAGDRIVAYVVDKRRPRPPRAEPGSGLYHESLRPVLSCDAGATVMWAVLGAEGDAADFAPYTKERGPVLNPPSKGSETRTLLAYAVNPAGLRSYPARFAYRMAEPGLPAAAPRVESPPLTPDPALQVPQVTMQRGYAELALPLAAGAYFLVDFSVASPPASVDDFERIESENGVAKLRIPCPYGWSGEVKLYCGTLNDGSAFYNPAPLAVALSYPAEESPEPPVPPSPIVAADPAGQGGFLAFPAYDGSIYVAIGKDLPRLYAAPITLSGDASDYLVSWYGIDAGGRKSAKQSGTFSLPKGPRDVELYGAAEGASIGGDVVLKPDAKSTAFLASSKGKTSVRYELRIDGSFPPEPGPASPLLGDSLSISCPPGEERSVVLRYRVLSDKEASEGRILRFTLDRKPPEPPRASGATANYYDRPTSLALEVGAGGKAAYASLSIDGESAPFLPLEKAIELAGSENGPVSYRLRAYSQDAAGNRSPEMEPIALVVDTTSVYVAEDGDDKGEGTPAKPLRSLDAAVAAALRDGKKNVNMRGSLELRSRVVLTRPLSFVGGFGESWAKGGTSRAVLKVSSSLGQPAFSAKGGELRFRMVELRAESAGSGPLIELEGSTLATVDSTLAAGSDGDFVLVSAVGSRLSLSGSQVRANRAMSFTAFSTDRCEIEVADSSIRASSGVRIFCAFDSDSGSLAIRQTLFECRSDLGLSLLSLRSASLLMDRSSIDASGGSGFLRLGLLKAVSGEVKNSKIAVSWNGPGTLFEIADGGPSFGHDTIAAAYTKGPMRFFDLRGKPIQVLNCILDCAGPDGELLRTDSQPKAGALAADCVWGFEYLLSGSAEARDIAEISRINASSPLYSSKPMISEPPEKSFDSPMKKLSSLKGGSACVGAALSLGSGYEVDFSGRPRPGPGKEAADIGADELF
jgi:hypothetical protein